MTFRKVRDDSSGTFSMIAHCEKTGELGVCVSTAALAVGGVVPHVELDVGAVATQATTNVVYGIKGLQLMRLGLSPSNALEALLREDEKREVRQVTMIDKTGRTAAFTGKETVEWKGHLSGKNYATAGNMLVGPQVIEAMARTFESTEGPLEERLMRVLEAGQKAGGDKRGRISAALLVRKRNMEVNMRPWIDLRVDEHSDPVTELRRIYEMFKARYLSVSKA
jgi:uncharacterized Ntn-hydrolase superfamily protein